MSLKQRHAAWLNREFRAAIRHFRTASAGDHTFNLKLVNTPAEATASGYSERGEQYSRRCTYRKTNSVHSFAIPKNWLGTVYENGLAVLDDMVTLSAQLVSEATGDEIEVYAAKWVRQSTGFSLSTGSGWIATNGEHHYHSTKSAADARSRLVRKLEWQGLTAEERRERMGRMTSARQERRTQQIEKLRDMISRYDLKEIGHIEVGYSDSRAAGNCHDGTLAFIEALTDDNRRSATIGEVVQLIQQRKGSVEQLATTTVGRQFVAACLHAIKRHRREARVREKVTC
jgi:hypothetical protein